MRAVDEKKEDCREVSETSRAREETSSRVTRREGDERVDVAPDVTDCVSMIEASDHPIARKQSQYPFGLVELGRNSSPLSIPQPNLQTRRRLTSIHLKLDIRTDGRSWSLARSRRGSSSGSGALLNESGRF